MWNLWPTPGVLVSRVRMPLTAVGGAAFFVTVFLDTTRWVVVAALLAFAAGMACYVRVGTPRGPSTDIGSPVSGRWLAMNSPTSRVPSHGVHAWSQTYACDLVAEPEGSPRPPQGWWPLARRPEEFPAFGLPIVSPVDGTVVRAVDRMRDHWSRTSPPAILWFVLEGVRELLGPAGVLGNHVAIRTDRGHTVLMAHLRRRSLKVGTGDRVERGDLVGECGNSGNTTEPHLHIQVMDRESPWIAAGVHFTVDGSALPPNGSHLQGESPA